MKIVLINPYELGRQPFALAEPTAWLRREGFEVVCIDLSQQRLAPEALAGAGIVALYLGMHTATRIAMEALPRIQALAPQARLCAYGLYAPLNQRLLRAHGVNALFGGEAEVALIELAHQVANSGNSAIENKSASQRVSFIKPDRSALPALSRYAHLDMPDGSTKVVGFTEASRGCKHLCRHCPVVPVYQGRFRAVPRDVVMEDIRQQVEAGAEHISFGDPDFLNGPTHALRLVRALHREFPKLSYDATIKIQHLLNHADLLSAFKETGCLFITSAVESLDDKVLGYLSKNHTRADFVRAVQRLDTVGIALAPTFIPFTPWTTLEGYIDLLRQIVDLKLVESVPPVQLSIRLLVPAGSYLLKLEALQEFIQDFDPGILGYRWYNPDARVDRLQRQIQGWVEKAEGQGLSRRHIVARIWKMAHQAAGRPAPPLPAELGSRIPALSEPWYCCAEPTEQQLQSF